MAADATSRIYCMVEDGVQVWHTCGLASDALKLATLVLKCRLAALVSQQLAAWMGSAYNPGHDRNMLLS